MSTNKLSKTITIERKLLQNLVECSTTLSYYLIEDEERHYQECEKDEQYGHIYNDILKVEDLTSVILDILNK